jgi:hypothetical protein
MNEIKKYFSKIGRKGGQAKSERKTHAARENIKKRWEILRIQKAMIVKNKKENENK